MVPTEESMSTSWGELVIWACLALAAAPVLYLALTTLAALLPRQTPPEGKPPRRIAIIVPAHNESLLIGDTVTEALALDYPHDAFTVLVIADNCTDDTATLARAAGARVLERQGNPGKGQGLNDALKLLLEENWQAFLVLDADSQLHRATLRALDGALAAGAAAVQIRYGVLNPKDSLRTRAMELSTASFNALRPRGKANLGLSAGINGNGFCLARETVLRVPYLAHSIVEDIEYHILLLRAGLRVAFLDQVWVKAQMPIGGRGAQVQRVRWERGRVITIRNYAPQLLRDLARGHPRALDGLIDVLMPPVSLVFLLLLPALIWGGAWVRGLAIGGVVVLAAHYLLAAWRYGSLTSALLLVAYIPWY
ncbi:MAG: glycosyltransferase, partial [Burkholderiales bacterium]